jgi:signal peptidase I
MEKETRARAVLGWVLAFGVAIVAAIAIRTFIFEIIHVDGPSMEPTLYTDESLVVEKVSRYFGLPERGDVIIVRYPHKDDTYVKRTIGLPGETIEIKDSIVYIDGVPLYEDYINSESYSDMEPTVVPEDHVFVMGDNRAHSWDSRVEGTGPIARDDILGHAVFVVYTRSIRCVR